MDLPKTTFFSFMEHFKQIGGKLSEAGSFDNLLDEARRDTPIIDGLMNMLDSASELPEEQERRKALNCVMRDIHLILTLRSLEQRAGNKTNDESQHLADRPRLRVRRASEN